MQKALELWRTSLIREPGPTVPITGSVTGPAHVGLLMAHLYGDAAQEHLVVFALNARHHVVGIHPVTTGIADASLAHAREVFRPAILANATAIIVAHNHPTGDLTLSLEDKQLAARLEVAGRHLGINVLDFIVTDHRGRWHSIHGKHAKGEVA